MGTVRFVHYGYFIALIGEFDAVLGKPLKKQQLKTQLSAWRLLPTDTQPPETQPLMSHIEDLVPKQMEEPIQK